MSSSNAITEPGTKRSPIIRNTSAVDEYRSASIWANAIAPGCSCAHFGSESVNHPLYSVTFPRTGGRPGTLKYPFGNSSRHFSGSPSNESNPWIILSPVRSAMKLIESPLYTPNSQYKPSAFTLRSRMLQKGIAIWKLSHVPEIRGDKELRFCFGYRFRNQRPHKGIGSESDAGTTEGQGEAISSCHCHYHLPLERNEEPFSR